MHTYTHALFSAVKVHRGDNVDQLWPDANLVLEFGDAKYMHVHTRYSIIADGAGIKKGHYDAMVPFVNTAGQSQKDWPPAVRLRVASNRAKVAQGA